MSNLIETWSLTKRFARRHSFKSLLPFWPAETLTVVDNVTLSVKEGELFGLLGPNGAGKTTLVKMLCTLILPCAGRASIAGYDLTRQATAVRQVIGLVNTHERSFFWRLTGRQNLEFFATLHNLRGQALQHRIADLLELLGLAPDADRLFMHYSTGMQQKLAIARGLLASPRLLFLDEPTRSLDPVSAHQVRQFIRTRLVDEFGCTVILVTHQLAEAETLCDRLAIMHQGRIVTCDSPAMIKQYALQRHRYRLQVKDMPYPALNDLQSLPGVARLNWSNGRPQQLELELDLIDEQAALPAVMRLIVERGGAIQQCRAAEVSLEEVFMQLIQEPGDGL